MDTEQHTELLYRELSSYKGTVKTYSLSTFEDVKYIGAVITIILVPPLMEKLLNPGVYSIILAFGFFASINLSLLWIEQRNCLKLSLIRFYMTRIKETEKEIQDINGGRPASLTQGVCWDVWSKQIHRPISKGVMETFNLILLVVPIGHLLFLGMTPLLKQWRVNPSSISFDSPSHAVVLLVGVIAASGYWYLYKWSIKTFQQSVGTFERSIPTVEEAKN